ncbi:MAG: ABC transporter substrate-binding protein, partial [Chloroflexi bacterium]|nr:ABC transporter substrate-binding protein [Chloroflexota bacterium]
MRCCWLLLLVMMLAACGAPNTPASSSAGGKLVVAQTIDIQSLDPFLVNQVAGESVANALFDHLIERDFDGNLVAGLAESWRVVDEQTLEFKLRSGVTFHNGEPFDAQAVNFSVQRMRDANLNSSFRGNFKVIKEVVVVDASTVRLLLDRTDAAFLDNLSAQLAIVPPRYLIEVGDAQFARKPVGTGPFKFVEWVKDDHVTLEANPNYWNGSFKGKPLVGTVVFRPVPEAAARIAELQTERADLIQDVDPDRVKSLQDGNLSVVAKDAPQEAFIFFVSDAPGTALADKRVRQALNYGVNVDAIIANVLQGYARRIASPIGALTLGYDAKVQPYPYDLAKAKQLLADAGYANGFDVVIDATQTDK